MAPRMKRPGRQPGETRRVVRQYCREVIELRSAAEAAWSAYTYPSDMYRDLRGVPFYNVMTRLLDAIAEIDVPLPPRWADLFYVTAVVEYGADRGRVKVMAGPYAFFAAAAEHLELVKAHHQRENPHENYSFWGVTGTGNLQARFITPRYPAVDFTDESPAECTASVHHEPSPEDKP